MFRRRDSIKIGALVLIGLSLFIFNGYARAAGMEDEALKKGIDYGRHDKYDEAITEFDNAIKANPNSANIYYDRGVIYDKKGELDQAIADFSKAIEIDPALTDAYYNRGFAYYKKGDPEHAISDYDKVIDLSPNSADAYYGRGLAYSKKGELDEAILEYNKAIELRPNFALAYDARAIAYFTKKNYMQTMADVNKAQSLGFKSRPLKRTSGNLNNGEKSSAPSQGTDLKKEPAKELKLEPDRIVTIVLSILLGISVGIIFLLLKARRPNQ